jgi:beta-glucosidase
VVQLYVTGKGKQAPIRSLKGFQRIFLKKGESKVVQFNLTQEDLSLMGENGTPKRFNGNVSIAVGGSQPDAASAKAKKTVQGQLVL